MGRAMPATSFSLLVCLLSSLLVGCSLFGGSSSPTGNTGRPAVSLKSLHWCDKPEATFVDDAASATPTVPAGNNQGTTTGGGLGPANGTPVVVKDWNTFKNNLGFTVFLPASLEQGACLLNVLGSVRNSLYGSNFTISYLLPDGTSLGLSEGAPRIKSTSLQCSVVPDTTPTSNGTPQGTSTQTASTPQATQDTKKPLQTCSGVRDNTSVTLSARWSVKEMQQLFDNLQSNVDWQPAS